MPASMRKGRMISILLRYCLFAPTARRNSAALFAAILQCPVFFSSCSEAPLQAPPVKGSQIYIQRLKNATAVGFDLFVFDTDGAQNLDACQHITAGEEIYVLSGTGEKRIVALCAPLSEGLDWEQMRTYGNLCKTSLKLEQDQPDQPLMAGETLAADGASRLVSLSCRSYLSAIRIRSVSCDFAGKPYAQLPVRCSRIFLLYAGSEYAPLGPGDGLPHSYLNPGFLEMDAIGRMKEPGMVLQEGFGAMGAERIYPGQTLYCYPNPVQEAGLGTPVTSVVLEVQAGAVTCWYNIPLPGLEAGTTTQLDLTLLRLGSPDPDLPTASACIETHINRFPWEEREAVHEQF